VPLLVLVNGPPASGKSTVAERLVATRPLALNLDIDLVRHQLGGWLDQPSEAGLAARALAVAMARTHLAAGHDVVVPQFLARAEFIGELEAVASQSGARFVEVGLVVDRATALDAFAERRVGATADAHADAAALVDRSTAEDPLGDMYDRYEALLATRPTVLRVEAARGDIDGTVAAIEAALGGVGFGAGLPRLPSSG
jgi:predicted kinase